MTYYLVAVDTIGIQTYLFGSNRLRENIGASEIVKQTTEEWVYETVVELKFNHNLSGAAPQEVSFDETRHIEVDNLDVEIIYAGGGNTALIFKSPETARKFITALTERAITEAPGLVMAAAQREFEWTTPLSQVYQVLMKDLARQKATHLPSVPLLGVGVTATCQSTGLPAVAIDPDDERLIAVEIEAKLKYRDKADERLERLFDVGRHGYEFARDFNQLGTPGEASYLAVVHADGNGIGGRIERIVAGYSTGQNRDFIQELRRFSQLLKEISTRSLQQVMQRLLERIGPDKRIVSNGLEIRLRQDAKSNKWTLPIRPLVVGGDDTTFVCDGRLGLTLAALYLQAFRKEATKHQEALHACAGVAVVHNHYPFARAYELSDTLCQQAKSYVRHKGKTTKEDGISALDWHFAISGLLNDLPTIRQQEYTVADGKLCIRPVRLTQPGYDPVHAWQTFQDVTLAFQGEHWADKRNKLKALREPLRNGPEATRHFLRAYDLAGKLPKIPQYTAAFQETGWSGNTCGYFDAIEAVDYFIDLGEIA